ncbi:MAG: hypothetical protein GWM98_08445 [Nitrospinaceae bacterium]|nr:hypothetical protein [Nitrospinaceae bacterium]NIR54523.1 hypothetical protein [Nitrospinaceae bacterium]NIS84942.1 hypothetical protein [Nitrospinaceae bacterium]NIT81756.1 hypothetical protein [Nitrospinaceae bacterium]NIU44025.1 hypothetical protein [Nitrospinaceae bacterium]
MSIQELKTRYDILQKMSFPDSEQLPELEELNFDLMEAVAYYSQLALAVIETGNYSLCGEADFKQVKVLKFRLESFRKIPGNDRPNVAYCKMYIIALEKMVQQLEEMH